MNIIGIDVSKSKLDCALIDNSTHRKLKFKVVSNVPRQRHQARHYFCESLFWASQPK
jgi:hypothetical protein